jgi:vancomycin permeability regulator SanA
MVRDDRRKDRTLSALRGVAAFLGAFALLSLIARARRGNAFDPNSWWLDLSVFPSVVQIAFMLLIAPTLLYWSINPIAGKPRISITFAVLVIAIAISLVNAMVVYRLLSSQRIQTAIPLPLSLLIASVLGMILVAVTRRPARLHLPTFATSIAACVVLFPLAQIAFFGHTDYRRRADAVVVFGARVYPDGRASDALADRTLTAIELYRQDLAPRLIFSGGPGDGTTTEAQAMRALARAHDIPNQVITLDEAGLNTDATVVNTGASLSQGSTVLAVSHAWHLPRVKLRFASEGIRCYTVPADERGKPLRKTPLLMLREVPAFWVYFLRTVIS